MNKLDLTLLLSRSGASMQQIRTAQNRLTGLRKIRIRRHTRQQLMDVIRTITTTGKLPHLLPGMVVRARVRRINLDQSMIVEVGKGGVLAVLPPEERIPTKVRPGQIKRGDTLWLAVKTLEYHPNGVRYIMTARSAHIPLELLKRQNPDLNDWVHLTVLERVPGVHSILSAQPYAVTPGIDYHAIVGGHSGQHLRAVSHMLRGEQIVLRINRKPFEGEVVE